MAGEFPAAVQASSGQRHRDEKLVSEMFSNWCFGGEIFAALTNRLFRDRFGENAALSEASEEFSDVFKGKFKEEGIARLIENIERVAIRSREPILLMGPTGAGKSQLARRIFELQKARHKFSGNCVEVNCATIRGDVSVIRAR